ncbi:MAG: hypothetical protein IJ806_08385 [Ruminococcus sp.]|nr:hypothetical protein [Ruminococcus sp.]
MDFRLCLGVSVTGSEGLESSFSVSGQEVRGLLSAELILKCAEGFLETVPEPVFFFLELPMENGGEGYQVYYLDNCTREVAGAIIKRYGQLLAEDGLCRFGFGSNRTEEEIYFTDYQEFSVYSLSPGKVRDMLKKLGCRETEEPSSLWDLMSDEEPGTLSGIEIEGETVFDIPENLKDAGMYQAQQ